MSALPTPIQRIRDLIARTRRPASRGASLLQPASAVRQMYRDKGGHVESQRRGLRGALGVALMLLLAACAGPRPESASRSDRTGTEARRGGTVTLAVTNVVPALAPIAATSSIHRFYDLHTSELVSSEEHSRKPVGRLAERVPSLENGDISLLPDGRMRVTYALRRGVTWHDGTPFTAHDLVFTYRFSSDPLIPFGEKPLFRKILSAEPPDDHTFVVSFSTAFHRADQLGAASVWPLPRHILGPAYERYVADGDVSAIVNLPYWTAEYTNTGAFRVAAFDPSTSITLEAYDGFFLGRPKLDTIHIKIFTDSGTLFANILAGTVDVFFENTVAPAQGFELMERWGQTGDGTVHLKQGAARFLAPQLRPAYQAEPTVALNARARAALYHAVDREAVSEALQGGHRELAAWSIVGPDHRVYDAAKDGFRKYGFDPPQAQAILRELGWVPGADGALRHNVDGRSFRTPIVGTAGRDREIEVAIIADFWRRIGLVTEEAIFSTAQVRDPEARATFPGWEVSSQAGGDATGRLRSPSASAENRWVGNRSGYENPRADQLLDRYEASLSYDAQFEAMKAFQELASDELPILMLYYTAYHIGAAKRLKALDDHAGAGPDYGTVSRNGHLWELR